MVLRSVPSPRRDRLLGVVAVCCLIALFPKGSASRMDVTATMEATADDLVADDNKPEVSSSSPHAERAEEEDARVLHEKMPTFFSNRKVAFALGVVFGLTVLMLGKMWKDQGIERLPITENQHMYEAIQKQLKSNKSSQRYITEDYDITVTMEGMPERRVDFEGKDAQEFQVQFKKFFEQYKKYMKLGYATMKQVLPIPGSKDETFTLSLNAASL